MIYVKGIPKEKLLQGLYNESKPQGLSILHFNEEKLSDERAKSCVDACESVSNWYFDYLYGRPIKIDISHDEIDPWLYDRDNGPGAAQRVVNAILKDMGIHK